jgi:hypothetical protein
MGLLEKMIKLHLFVLFLFIILATLKFFLIFFLIINKWLKKKQIIK